MDEIKKDNKATKVVVTVLIVLLTLIVLGFASMIGLYVFTINKISSTVKEFSPKEFITAFKDSVIDGEGSLFDQAKESQDKFYENKLYEIQNDSMEKFEDLSDKAMDNFFEDMEESQEQFDDMVDQQMEDFN